MALDPTQDDQQPETADAEQTVAADTADDRAANEASQPVRKRRRWIPRVALVALVIPAVIAWQHIASEPVAIERQALEELDGGTLGILNAAIADSSPTMVAFYKSDAFDPYVTWYAEHDDEEVAMHAQYDDKCDRALAQVWLPPYAGRVRDDCDALRDATLNERRGMAFGPVLLEYVRRCQTGRAHPPRLGNPYTEDQWADFTVVVNEALDADCDPSTLPTLPDAPAENTSTGDAQTTAEVS